MTDLPVGNSRAIAHELIKQLEKTQRIDGLPPLSNATHPPRPSLHSGHPSRGGESLKSPPAEGCPQGGVGSNLQSELINHKFSTNYLFGDARGQMFGVLECKDGSGNTIILKAFSCQYNGEWLVDGWVPPIFDVDAFHKLTQPVYKKINALGRRIKTFDPSNAATHPGLRSPLQKRGALEIPSTGGVPERRGGSLNSPRNDISEKKELIEQRAALSRNLMREIHNLYTLTNFNGEKRPLFDVFDAKTVPAGTGDCCAPKLLNYAALNGLKPIGLSEFYFGKESKSGEKQHGEFYPPCIEKCQPILEFMLEGAGDFSRPLVPRSSRQAAKGEKLCAFAPLRELSILFADADLVVVSKPSGLLSVPGKGPNKQDCVVARIKKLYPDCPDHPEVHRLDMDTSGLMVLARTKEAHRELSRQFHDRETGKRYIALLDGELNQTQQPTPACGHPSKGGEFLESPPREGCRNGGVGLAAHRETTSQSLNALAKKSGTIELPFRLDIDNRPTQIYDPVHGKIGLTHWKTLSVENGQTRVEFVPITGRTHQLRVHAASEHGLGTPIVGDRLYGSGTEPGQLKLHAAFLSFTHPTTGEKLEFHSEPTF